MIIVIISIHISISIDMLFIVYCLLLCVFVLVQL